MKLTADTITDAQIRELRERLLTEHFQMRAERHPQAVLCGIALSEQHGIERIEARVRCAEILNARSSK